MKRTYNTNEKPASQRTRGGRDTCALTECQKANPSNLTRTGVRVGVAEMPFGAIASDSVGGAGGTCVLRGCVPKKLFVYAASYPEEFNAARGFGCAPLQSRRMLHARIVIQRSLRMSCRFRGGGGLKCRFQYRLGSELRPVGYERHMSYTSKRTYALRALRTRGGQHEFKSGKRALTH